MAVLAPLKQLKPRRLPAQGEQLAESSINLAASPVLQELIQNFKWVYPLSDS